MINLLPPQQKEELISEENLKITLIWGIVILASLISFGLILFSIKNFILTDLEVQKVALSEAEKEMEDPAMKKAETTVTEYNTVILKLKSFYQSQNSLTEILEKIAKTIPTGSYLTSFNISKNASEISLAGYCPSRQILFDFNKNLEAMPDFKEVSFPAQNWNSPQDINFQVFLKLK